MEISSVVIVVQHHTKSQCDNTAIVLWVQILCIVKYRFRPHEAVRARCWSLHKIIPVGLVECWRRTSVGSAMSTDAMITLAYSPECSVSIFHLLFLNSLVSYYCHAKENNYSDWPWTLNSQKHPIYQYTSKYPEAQIFVSVLLYNKLFSRYKVVENQKCTYDVRLTLNT